MADRRNTPPDSLFAGVEVPAGYRIRAFTPADQAPAKNLVLAGLAERWGQLDTTLNPDLNDIWQHYVASGGAFVVALFEDAIVGTGALSREEEGVMRIERVSVASDHRRCGLGRALSDYLIALARQRNCTRLLVETTDTWHSAIRLYQECGFVPFEHRGGDIHMVLNLTLPR